MSPALTRPFSRFGAFAAALAVWLATAPALALPDDREQPIHIESDRAERQERAGLTIYEGEVVITQGSIRVEADRVTVHTEGNQVIRIEAIGEPAHYQQMVERDGAPLSASSQLIDYRVQEEQIILSRDARLEQQGTTITGERIEYDLVQEIIRAQGDVDGRQRIRMVIPPGSQPRRDAAPDDANPPTNGP